MEFIIKEISMTKGAWTWFRMFGVYGMESIDY
jgi:hypothetical protein